MTLEAYTLLQDIYEMTFQGLLTIPGRTFRSCADITPQEMKTNGVGQLLYNLMDLKDAEKSDLDLLCQLLQ